jgi:hypothetical protein
MDLTVWCSNLGRFKRYFSPSQHDGIQCKPEYFPGGKEARREADHSHPFTAEVKNV